MAMRDPLIELSVHLDYDEEAAVWYVAQSDVPGLNLDDTDPHQLMRRIDDCVPELIELNMPEIWEKHVGAFSDRAKPSRRFAMKPVFDSPFKYALA